MIAYVFFLKAVIAVADLLFSEVRLPGLDGPETFDVVVDGGLIVDVGRHFQGCAASVVPGRGRLLMPGAIDMHVHFREPGATHKEDLASGSNAALLAGVTTVCDMPNNTPPITTASEFMSKAELAAKSGRCDVMLYMALTASNLEQVAMVKSHPAFAGVKVFLGATTGNMICDIDAVARAAAVLDSLFVFHAESDVVLRQVAARLGEGTSAGDHLALRPVIAATTAVRQIASTWRPGMRFHICHVSCREEVEIISSSGGITCEAAPHHMGLSAADTGRLGNLAKMNPPLRDSEDAESVLQAVCSGAIDCVATDHAPHTLAEKAVPYPKAPAGVPGVDTLVPFVMSLVRSGRMTTRRAAAVTAGNPARILGLSDRGAIAPGMRADLYLTDPSREWVVSDGEIRSKCGWSPFSGRTLSSRPDVVCFKGRLVE